MTTAVAMEGGAAVEEVEVVVEGEVDEEAVEAAVVVADIVVCVDKGLITE